MRMACLAAMVVLPLHQRLVAQQPVLRGSVTEFGNGNAIAGARITSHRGIVTTSDAGGRFSIILGGTGSDTLRVIRIGYQPIDVVVTAGLREAHITMETAPVVLQAIVSLASRRNQSAADVAISVLTLTDEEILESGALGLNALLQDIPGLQQSIEPPARSALQIRGIGGSRVLVLVDGEPVPGALLEDRDLSRISLQSARQVEVVKGPLAAIHGSEALGGVINVVTRTPEGPLSVAGQVGTGSNGRRHALVEVGSGGAVAWQLSLAHRSVDQLATQAVRPDALQRLWDVRAMTETRLSRNLTLRVHGSALRERQRWPVDGTINAFNDNTAWNAWVEAQHGSASRVLRGRVSVQQFAHRYREAAGKLPFADTGTPTQREHAARLLLTATTPLGSHHVLDAGFEGSVRRVDAADRLDGGSLEDRGLDLWLQDTWQYGMALVTLAGRQSFSSRWGRTFTPAFTTAIEPSSAWRLHGSVARGFRGPSFKESGWSFSNAGAGYIVEGNPELVPEHSWQFSAGAAWRMDSETRIDVEVFRNTLTNLIDLRAAGTNSAGLQRYRPVNVSRASTQGADLSVHRTLGHTDATLSWSWLATRDASTGEPLPERIPHSVRLSGRTLIGPANITVTGSWSASISPGLAGAAGREDFLAWDISARWPILGSLELHTGIDNVFNATPQGWLGPIERALRISVTMGLKN